MNLKTYSPIVAMTCLGIWAGMARAGTLIEVYPEFRVNTYTTEDTFASAVTSAGPTQFVVVWPSDGRGAASPAGVFLKRYAAPMTALGPESEATTPTSVGAQEVPAACGSPDGTFVVVWTGSQSKQYHIDGRRFESTGTPSGSEFRVDSGGPSNPAISCDPSGNFVVVWNSRSGADPPYSIFGRRYASNGTPQGTKFTIASSPFGFYKEPSICHQPSGQFFVVWQNSHLLLGQKFSEHGAKSGLQFQVNTYTSNYQLNPAVACRTDGGFLVAWENYPVRPNRPNGQDGDGSGIFAQQFNATGERSGTVFQVNTYTTGHQVSPSAAYDEAGNFVIVWQDRGYCETYGIHNFCASAHPSPDGSSYGIAGRAFRSGLLSDGEQFQVNGYTTERQTNPAVTSTGAGNFIVVWGGAGPDAADGVYGQQILLVHPVSAALPWWTIVSAALLILTAVGFACRGVLSVWSSVIKCRPE